MQGALNDLFVSFLRYLNITDENVYLCVSNPLYGTPLVERPSEFIQDVLYERSAGLQRGEKSFSRFDTSVTYRKTDRQTDGITRAYTVPAAR